MLSQFCTLRTFVRCAHNWETPADGGVDMLLIQQHQRLLPASDLLCLCAGPAEDDALVRQQHSVFLCL